MSQHDGRNKFDSEQGRWPSDVIQQTPPGGELLSMDDYITRAEFRDALAQFERRIEDRLHYFGESLRSNVREDNTRLASEVNAKVDAVKPKLASLEQVLTTKLDSFEQVFTTKLGSLEQVFTTKLDSIEQVFATKLGGLEQMFTTKLESLDRDAKRRLWIMGGVIVALMTLVQILVRYLLK